MEDRCRWVRECKARINKRFQASALNLQHWDGILPVWTSKERAAGTGRGSDARAGRRKSRQEKENQKQFRESKRFSLIALEQNSLDKYL